MWRGQQQQNQGFFGMFRNNGNRFLEDEMELWQQQRKDEEYEDEDDYDEYDDELDEDDDDEWEHLLDQMTKPDVDEDDVLPKDFENNIRTNKKDREGETMYKNTARLLKSSKSGGAYNDDDYYSYRQGKGKGKGGGYSNYNGGKGKGKGGGYSGYDNGGKGKGKGGGYSGYDNGGKGKGKGKGKGGGYDDYYYGSQGGKGKNLNQMGTLCFSIV
jgi:hypothetical protein